jgi:predicted TPR repeat methyltransferase
MEGNELFQQLAPSQERLERLALLGEWHLNSGRIQEAKSCFDTVLKWRPQSALAAEHLHSAEGEALRQAHS